MAGIDMDMVSEGLLMTIEKSLKDKKATMAQLDIAVRRILEAKYRLGLFEDPYRYCNIERSKTEVYTDANRTAARRIASESLVLMKNEGNVLPLKRGSKILLTGPLADNAENMPGTWSVAALFDKAITVLRGIKEVGGSSTNITYVRGSNLDYDPAFEERAGMFGKDLRRDMRPSADIIAEAVAAAKDVDVIVAAVGESAEMSGESSSRTSLDIPQAQKDLLMALKKTGKPIVLVLFTGRPLTLVWEKENIPAILNVWFAGSEAGYAIADVLFGDVNPSGKLTTTFPQNLGQVPIFYNYKNTGRPLAEGKWFSKFKTNYLDVTNDPLFPFGFGLSYSKFYYGNMKVSATQLKGNQTLTVSVPVTNNGKVAGKEVVQLYIRDVVGSTTRPVKELKNFDKVLIQPGETKTVTFTITPEDLKFYNYDLQFDWEAGDFDIMIGPNSREVQVKRVFWQNEF
jgi:beta-glucosidase